MISFKEFLLENQGYPLYHGLNIDSLSQILKTNSIRTGWIDKESHWPSSTGSIVSTTRSFNFAKNWSLDFSREGAYYVIQLDRQKLRQRYKVIPFNYFGSELNDALPKARWQYGTSFTEMDRNQFEEAITKDIKPALPYITAVIMNSKAIKSFKKFHGAEYSLLIRHGLLKEK